MAKQYLTPTKAGKLALRLTASEYEQLCNLVHVCVATGPESADPFQRLPLETLSCLLNRLLNDLGCPLRDQFVRREKNNVHLTIPEALALFIMGNPRNPIGFVRLVLNEIHQKLA
jgi:hypothetical protein